MIYSDINMEQMVVESSGKPTKYFESLIHSIVEMFMFTTITADANVSIDYSVWLIDATSGNVTATLPDAADVKGSFFVVKRIDGSGNTATIAASDNIDGAATKTLTQYESRVLASDGSTWHIIAAL